MQRRIFLVSLYLLGAFHAFSQQPFKKGNIHFIDRSVFSFTDYKSLINYNPRSADLRLAADYFIVDGLAAGIDYAYNSSADDHFSSYRYQRIYLALMYGRKIVKDISAYLKVRSGPGHSFSAFGAPGTGSRKVLPADYFDWDVTLGVPLALASDGNTFLTPYLTYEYGKTKTYSSDFVEKGLVGGIRFETYLPAAGGKKGKSNAVAKHYAAGDHFLDFNSMISFSHTNRQQYDNFGTNHFAPLKVNNSNIALSYHYYFVKNVAGGLAFSWRRSKQGYQNAQRYTDRTFVVTPQVTVQAPRQGKLNHLFLQAGYGFGKTSSPVKSIHDLTLKAGYNLFLAQYVSLTPRFGYERYSTTVKQGVSGIPYVNSGLVGELGFRVWLGFVRW